ncbi:Signal transduction histidine kinase [Chitinophaga rupis]|uniref:histidine kinase n=1 Tax=Chitinophaga rupis TaxID=573321 RepID=A0A1H7Y6V9_9BACT|nr:response regulator [Chitinophaga rupis]SEM41661.1 Signal transduction histidine kinase [Chitinophaga rupis]
MKPKLKIGLFLGFGVALVLVITAGVFSYLTFHKQRTEAGWVEHTYEVITLSQRINRIVYEMESAGITFRSTHDTQYLAPYYAQRSKPLPLVQELKKMVADNTAEARRATQIENNMIALLNFWEQLDTKQDSNYIFSHVIPIAKEERKYLNQVHTSLADLITAERNLLVIRNEQSNRAVSHATVMLVVNTLLILLVASILMIISYRELSNRIKAQRELKHKLTELVNLNHTTNEKNWLLSGISQVNESLHGQTSIIQRAEQCLLTLVQYLALPAGAVYYYDEEEKLLKLAAGIALPANPIKTYALQEGLIGQAATQKEIQVLKDIPAHYWQISAAALAGRPGALLYVPLWVDSRLIGVLELASFQEVQPKQLTFLKGVTDAIATAFQAAISRTRVLSLLETVQSQKEILETQQARLQETNSELRASEEELRVHEEELRQVNEEMKAKNHTLELAKQELARKAQEVEQSSKYKSEFLANMSHELRTPLNSVLILARMLEENKERNLSAKQMEYAGIIHRSGSDLLKLINDILDLSKIEAGKLEINIEEVPIAAVMYDLEQLFYFVAEQKQIHFITTIAPGVPANIHTDRQRLEQVIRNLLSNAFKFTPSGGTVRLQCHMQDDSLHIAVADTGMGIPLDKQLQVFEAFRQADGSTSRRFGGTGLGLSISRELVKMLGGEIRLQSREGEGSTFTVVMPVAAITQQISAGVTIPHTPIPLGYQKEAAPVADDREQLSKGDTAVLIIEDDANFATILRDFARQKGYKTVVALNGSDGLFFARKYLPAAIILDVNLPFIDGHSILKVIRNSPELKHILVHIISSGEISLQVSDHVQGYTQKPLQMNDLEAVFSGIQYHVQEDLKKVLIISGNSLLQAPSLQPLSDERQLHTEYRHVKNIQEAASILPEESFDGIVLDIGSNVQEGIRQLSLLRSMVGKDKPLIVYLDRDISEADEMQLKKEAAAIIRDSTFSRDRLLDELALFLFRVNEAKEAPLQATASIPAEQGLEGQKVLLADDDMRNLFSLKALLSGKGLQVITATDGKEALQQLETHPDIRLVLMDIMMPEMDGYEAIRHIRNNERTALLPVIALTAKAMAGDREKCISAGASDYIAKPVDGNKLFSLLRVWLG